MERRGKPSPENNSQFQAPKRDGAPVPTQPRGKEVTQTDLSLLHIYALQSGLLRDFYPPDMATSVAPPPDRQLLKEK
jgi:hypothetical protein